MMRKLGLAVVVAVVMASPLRAELKYTTHMEAHKSTVVTPSDPMFGGMADAFEIPAGFKEVPPRIGGLK